MWRRRDIAMALACGLALPAAADTVLIDQPFVLQLGQQLRWPQGELTLHFERVLLDSRCPRGERCVIAGVARIRIRVEGAGAVRQDLDLQLPDQPSGLLPAQAATLTLLRLTPYPVSGQVAAPVPVQATLVIRKGSATER